MNAMLKPEMRVLKRTVRPVPPADYAAYCTTVEDVVLASRTARQGLEEAMNSTSPMKDSKGIMLCPGAMYRCVNMEVPTRGPVIGNLGDLVWYRYDGCYYDAQTGFEIKPKFDFLVRQPGQFRMEHAGG